MSKVMEEVEGGVSSPNGLSFKAGLEWDLGAMEDGFIVLEPGVGANIQTLVLMLHEEHVAWKHEVWFYRALLWKVVLVYGLWLTKWGFSC